MSVTLSQVRDIFKNLVAGNGSEFFTHVADNVDWTVEGTHPLAGHYHRKADFLANTFEKLGKVLPQGTQLEVEHALVSGDWASFGISPGMGTARCNGKNRQAYRNLQFREQADITGLGKSFAWACGPPIDMKIKPSREYDQAGVGRQRSWQLWVK